MLSMKATRLFLRCFQSGVTHMAIHPYRPDSIPFSKGKHFPLLLIVSCASCFCLSFLWAICFSAIAYADGGAPNLAYVAGAAHGISVIDVLQRRVTRTITLADDPPTVLL